MTTCFSLYFNPVYIYLKRLVDFTFDNDNIVFISSISIAALTVFIQEFFQINYFGVSNGLLLWVISTILLDALFGVNKSFKEHKLYLLQASRIRTNTAKRRMLLKKASLKKFKPLKLQFTFFKILTFLAYLFFAKNILEAEVDGDAFITIIGIASGIVIKAPIAIFWYYDFKSIGSNLEFILGKKLPIFIIVEKIFEPKIFKFLNSDKKDLDNDN
jgi:hypothetical protein